MTVTRITYKQDAPGRTAPYPGSPYLPFGAFVMSPRMQGLVNKISRDVAVIARMLSPESEDEREDKPRYKDSFGTAVGKPVKIDGLTRVSGLVFNTSPQAPAVEFGSGSESIGDAAGEDRPQGGYNKPFRVLGKAGRIMGDFHE